MRFDTLDYVIINAQRKQVNMADKWVLYNPTARSLVSKQGDDTSLRRAAYYASKGWADRTNAKLGGKFEVRQAKTLKQALNEHLIGQVYPVEFELVGEVMVATTLPETAHNEPKGEGVGRVERVGGDEPMSAIVIEQNAFENLVAFYRQYEYLSQLQNEYIHSGQGNEDSHTAFEIETVQGNIRHLEGYLSGYEVNQARQIVWPDESQPEEPDNCYCCGSPVIEGIFTPVPNQSVLILTCFHCNREIEFRLKQKRCKKKDIVARSYEVAVLLKAEKSKEVTS